VSTEASPAEISRELSLRDLEGLSSAASFIRSARGLATSITVNMPALDDASVWRLERACRLAVAQGDFEVELHFAGNRTTVCLLKPGAAS
jgi:hypothetical protein